MILHINLFKIVKKMNELGPKMLASWKNYIF